MMTREASTTSQLRAGDLDVDPARMAAGTPVERRRIEIGRVDAAGASWMHGDSLHAEPSHVAGFAAGGDSARTEAMSPVQPV